MKRRWKTIYTYFIGANRFRIQERFENSVDENALYRVHRQSWNKRGAVSEFIVDEKEGVETWEECQRQIINWLHSETVLKLQRRHGLARLRRVRK